MEISSRDQLILDNQHLVGLEVRKCVKRNPGSRHLADEMESAGLLALVEACDTVTKAADVRAPESYIGNAIYRACQRVVDQDRSFAQCRKTHHKNRAAKQDRRRTSPILPTDSIAEPSNEGETLDDVQSLCHTDLERQVIALRAERHNDREIAERLNTSRQSVLKARHAVYARYQLAT